MRSALLLPIATTGWLLLTGCGIVGTSDDFTADNTFQNDSSQTVIMGFIDYDVFVTVDPGDTRTRTIRSEFIPVDLYQPLVWPQDANPETDSPIGISEFCSGFLHAEQPVEATFETLITWDGEDADCVVTDMTWTEPDR